MNSKYKEVPRANANATATPTANATATANHARFQGVSSAAIAAREAEAARARARVDADTGVPKCVWTAVAALYVAVILDGTAWATTAWGVSNRNVDGVFMQVGLWQICTTKTIRPHDGNPETDERISGMDVPTRECVFPTSVPRDWIHKALVMEIMGGFCALALFFCLTVLLASVKCAFVETRTMVITLIPLAFLAALMNLIGALMISLNLSTINCTPSYSVALEYLGVASFSIGGGAALMEIQDCFRANPEEDPEIFTPVIHRPPPTFAAS